MLLKTTWLTGISFSLIGIFAASCSDTRGTAGESCRARNDCRTGLACVSGVCVPGGLDLSATGKSCYRVECGANADCCADFVPASGCDAYEAECLMDPTNCYAF